jgi:hypothetical protein
MTFQKMAEVLRTAATKIEENGWCQGVYYNRHDGGYCIVGAVRESAGTWDPWYFERAIGNFARKHGIHNLVTYNDTFGRTKEEVCAKLRKLADLAEEENIFGGKCQ